MQIKTPQFLGLHAKPSKTLSRVLAALPFVILILAYVAISEVRHAVNPDDSIFPTVGKMANTMYEMAFVPDKISGDYLLYEDTFVSLKRLGLGVVLATVMGLLVGLNMGIFGGLTALSSTFMTFLSIVPPLVVLPIMLIVFGVDDIAKVSLIFIGTFPLIARSMFLATKKLPRQQITKALTLGASEIQVVYQVIMPQILPRLIDSVRLSFGAGWLFLITSEAIVSSVGLGYRIYLARRYFGMDVIIPYGLWITFLGYSIDWSLRKFVAWRYPWYEATKD